jgi:hypothetical protein
MSNYVVRNGKLVPVSEPAPVPPTAPVTPVQPVPAVPESWGKPCPPPPPITASRKTKLAYLAKRAYWMDSWEGKMSPEDQLSKAVLEIGKFGIRWYFWYYATYIIGVIIVSILIAIGCFYLNFFGPTKLEKCQQDNAKSYQLFLLDEGDKLPQYRDYTGWTPMFDCSTIPPNAR